MSFSKSCTKLTSHSNFAENQVSAQSLKLTFDNAVVGEKLRVVRPFAPTLIVDQIVTLAMLVKGVEGRHPHRKVSGVIINRGEPIPDEKSYIVWDIERFEKFV